MHLGSKWGSECSNASWYFPLSNKDTLLWLYYTGSCNLVGKFSPVISFCKIGCWFGNISWQCFNNNHSRESFLLGKICYEYWRYDLLFKYSLFVLSLYMIQELGPSIYRVTKKCITHISWKITPFFFFFLKLIYRMQNDPFQMM